MNFVLIGLCILGGMLLRASGTLPENSHKGINAWILYVAMPSVTLLYIPQIRWSNEMILPAAMPVLVWAGAWLSVRLYARIAEVDNATQTALLLTAGLGNTSFLGFPLTQAYFGDGGLRVAVICDQVSFVILSTAGVISAVKAVHGSGYGLKGMLKNALRFPPLLAFFAALIASRFSGMAYLDPLLTRLSATLVPLALFSVGMQIRIEGLRSVIRPLSVGLAYKLIAAPAIVCLAALPFGIRGIIAQTSVFESAMPPMITSAILASEYGLNPRLSNLMASIGIVASMASTAVWYFILKAFSG